MLHSQPADPAFSGETIVHGIQPCKGKGVVTISVAECGNRVRIAVRDTGHGIDPKVIERVEANEMPCNKIGLLNVHHRVKLLYGEGLHIRRLEPDGNRILHS